MWVEQGPILNHTGIVVEDRNLVNSGTYAHRATNERLSAEDTDLFYRVRSLLFAFCNKYLLQTCVCVRACVRARVYVCVYTRAEGESKLDTCIACH